MEIGVNDSGRTKRSFDSDNIPEICVGVLQFEPAFQRGDVYVSQLLINEINKNTKKLQSVLARPTGSMSSEPNCLNLCNE